MRKQGANINRNDDALLSGLIELNDSTPTTVQVAVPNRVFWGISNPKGFGIYLKMQAASVDNLKNGIYIPANSYWEMPGEKYTGEISAIAESGTPEVFTTQY